MIGLPVSGKRLILRNPPRLNDKACFEARFRITEHGRDEKVYLMATQVKIDPAELTAKAEAIFRERISALISQADQTKFVLIDIDAGAFEVGSDDLELEERLLKSYPNAMMVLLRADGGAAGQFGWPLTAGV